MTPLPPDDLLAAMNWRYAAKLFDSTKVIPPETWAALEKTLILTPSSYGLQPWRFIVITDRAVREKLLPHSWNQKQVTDCSHYVVFASVTSMTVAAVDRYLARTAEMRGATTAAMAGYRTMMVNDIVEGPRGKASHEWAARQAYIALGNFMTAAALLRVDTCPMEGFVPEEYDKILGLAARGLTAAVCCAAGYRSAACKYAGLPKVRFPASEMIEHI